MSFDGQCPRCDVGCLTPFTTGDWDGPMICSHCGDIQDVDVTGCLNCRRWFPNEQAWLDHRAGCFLEADAPSAATDVGGPSGPTAVAAHPSRKSHPNALERHTRRLVIGSKCRKGHTMTKHTMYVSPKNVATCKVCRTLRRRAA